MQELSARDATAERLAGKLERMRRTVDDLATAIRGIPAETLVSRPAPQAWAATEIVCHLRDVEEFYLWRVQLILAKEQSVLPVLEADRWALDRQYIRNDIGEALTAFRARRGETLKLLDGLTPPQWGRAGLHPLRGTLTVARIVGGWSKHDDEHIDQLRRAVSGRP